MVFVRGFLGEEHKVYARRMKDGRRRELATHKNMAWRGRFHDAGGSAHTSSRRAGRHARGATLTRSLGAVKDRDLLTFLAEDLCRHKALDHAHGSLATRTA